MKVRSKKPVWGLLKLMELLFTIGCCLVHWRCFRYHGVPHVFILCGAYGGSIIIGILSMVSTFYAEKPRMKFEAAHAGVLGSIHLLTVFAHMYMAKMDYYHTKTWATFYHCCRDNAVVALFAAAIYFLHLTFALDLMLSHQPHVKKHAVRSKRALSLYFISPGVEEYVSRYWWFQHLASRMMTSVQVSEHSGRNKNMSYDTETDEEQRVSISMRPDEGRVSGVFRRSTGLVEPI
ncbi:hypothetical protein KR032_005949 [Drosophila birchii]|nr:hypothetical protein KR032_005949 [Drosophila birchii]